MSRSLLLVLVGLAMVAALLVALDVIPLGQGGGGDAADGDGTADLLEGGGADGSGTLKGRGLVNGGEEEATDPAPMVTVVPAEVRGTTKGGAVVHGRVVQADGGIPLSGVKVQLNRPDSIIAYLRAKANGRYDTLDAVTRADGTFTFLDVTPSKGYVVRARHERFAIASTEDVLDLRGRETVDVGDLKMGPGGALKGRVIDAEEKPVAAARVVATWRISNPIGVILSDPDMAPELERECTTDEDGLFTLERLDPAAKTIFAVAPTGATQIVRSVRVEDGKTKTIDDIKLPGAGYIAGRVQWKDGKPIAGARVFAAPMRRNIAATRASETDAAGAFKLAWLPDDGNVGLGVLVRGLPIYMQTGIELGRQDLLVEFENPGSLRGKVVQADGEPIGRFFLQVDEKKPPDDWMMKMLRAQVKRGLGPQPFEDPKGAYAIPRVAAGTYNVTVTATGFPAITKQDVTVVSGETTELVVELPRGNVARGDVFRADGSRLAGARLYALPGGLPRSVKTINIEGAVSNLEPDSASRGDGSFELPPKTPGKFDIVATHPEALPGVARGVDLSGGDVSDIEIRLPPSGRVRGLVLDEHARPAPNEEIYILYRSGLVRTLKADDKGRFESKGLPVGRALVRWMSMRDSAKYSAVIGGGSEDQKASAYDDLRQDGGEHELADGNVVQVTVRLPRRVKVTGRILVAGLHDKRIRGAWMQMQGAHNWIRINCDEHGHYEHQLEPGFYRTWLLHSDGSWKQMDVEIPDTTAHQLDLDAP